MTNPVLAVRVFAGAVAGSATLSLVTYAALRSAGSWPDPLPEVLANAGIVVNTGGQVLFVTALALLATTVRSEGRRLAVAALCLTAGGLVFSHAVSLIGLALPGIEPGDALALMRVSNTLTSLAIVSGMVCALAVVPRLLGRGTPVFWGSAGTYGTLALASLVLMWLDLPEWNTSWGPRVMWLTMDLILGTGALWLAALLARDAHANQEVLSRARPVRWLAWATVGKLAVSVVAMAPALIDALVHDSSSAWLVQRTATWLSLSTTLVVVVALGLYLGLPRSHRGAGTVWVMVGALGITEALNLGLVYSAGSYSRYAQALDPSDSGWRVAASGVLGFTAMLCLARALRLTASAIGAHQQTDAAKRAIKLQWILVVALPLVFGLVMAKAPAVLLLIGSAALVTVSALLLITWLRLLFGLASALDQARAGAQTP